MHDQLAVPVCIGLQGGVRHRAICGPRGAHRCTHLYFHYRLSNRLATAVIFRINSRDLDS
jgi:hypothetical protein